MVIVNVANRVAVIAYICVLGSYSCSTGSDGTVQGILGEGASLTCMSTSCGSMRWTNDSLRGTSPFVEASIHTSVNSYRDSYELHIFEMSAYDIGSYSCWCNENNGFLNFICSDSLELVCQAEVVINNTTKLHNSSHTDTFPVITINANVRDRVKVKCPDGAVAATDCKNVLDIGSVQFTYNFKASWEHHGCTITCQVKKKTNIVCSVTFTINISKNETSTHYSTVSTAVLTVSPPVNEIAFTTLSPENITLAPAYTTTKVDDKKDNNINSVTDKPVSFSVIIGVCILVFIVVVVTFVVSFYIFSLSSKSRSQSTQYVNVVNPPSDANIAIGATYATVNKSNWLVKRNYNPIEPEFLNSDGFYSEIDDAGMEDSSTRQPNYMKAETSVTNDHYAEVNKSDTKIKTMKTEQETDCTLYAGVNRGGN
ncbi:hypothetical protein HOLleu_24689 [Holothuria leucospilota]|uniref:Ig-like domain-containing protein n=1 Tax=Holothuria leucospilota TaxID=206669 RepID=A0A9Q1H3E2_HOLLE|nr:hypothetical protein HOLleu_24689 [Holothuria leucospilota]